RLRRIRKPGRETQWARPAEFQDPQTLLQKVSHKENRQLGHPVDSSPLRCPPLTWRRAAACDGLWHFSAGAPKSVSDSDAPEKLPFGRRNKYGSSSCTIALSRRKPAPQKWVSDCGVATRERRNGAPGKRPVACSGDSGGRHGAVTTSATQYLNYSYPSWS